MIEMLHRSSPEVLGFQALGRLTEEDYEMLIPRLRRQIEDQGGVRAVADVTALTGMEPRAVWDEIRFDTKHAGDITRCAVIGDKRWHAVVTEVADTLIGSGRVRFSPLEAEDAWRFASESNGTTARSASDTQ